ncbi:LDLR chaperone boca [Scaptodrosophila lebanonensis]|uniref:LDLR chaperone boca n=1 Tax=Drosophila lebanonensis TaxID=7225 RepID=A0A6J2UG68_DROLE|nr:LDLR chaperone boca [Scaptodrosophila lebanonensis]
MLNKLLIVAFLVIIPIVLSKKFEGEEKPAWAKKDIRDYTDADLERLLDQWEEDEEPLEADELPEHLRPQPKLDLSNLDSKNPEELLKVSKKGRTLMTFVTVSGNPTREESESITKLWQTSLWNNHIQAERYMVDDNRAIFLFKDGAQAWEAKDFLVEQERCKGVTIENKEYTGTHAKDEL